MTETNLQSLRSFAEAYAAAWCSQRPASVASFFETDGSLKVNDDAPAVGREAITRIAQSFMTDFPDLQVTMNDLVQDNEGIKFHWTLNGTNSGPGGTNRKVKLDGFEIWQLGTNNLIANSLGHFDSEDYKRQLGS